MKFRAGDWEPRLVPRNLTIIQVREHVSRHRAERKMAVGAFALMALIAVVLVFVGCAP